MNKKNATKEDASSNKTMWNFVTESIETDPELIIYFLIYLACLCLPFYVVVIVYKTMTSLGTAQTTYLLSGSALAAIAISFTLSSVFQVIISFTIMERTKGNNSSFLTALKSVFKNIMVIAFVSFMSLIVFIINVTLVMFIRATFRDNQNNFIEAIFKAIFFAEGIAATTSAQIFLSHMIPIAIYHDEINPIKVRDLTLNFIQNYFPEKFKISTGAMKIVLVWMALFFLPMIFFRNQSANSPIAIYYYILVYSIIPLFLIIRGGTHIVFAKLVFILNQKNKNDLTLPIYFSELGVKVD